MENNYELRTIQTTDDIVIIDLNLPEKLIDVCIETARNIGDQQDKKTNVKALMTSWNISKKNKCFETLKCYLVRQAENILANRLKNAFTNGGATLNCYNDWVAIYKENEHTNPHDHVPAAYSFVYYLKAEETDPGLTFPENNLTIPVKSGRFMLFSGNLVHSVEKSSHVRDRIVYAGNCNVR